MLAVRSRMSGLASVWLSVGILTGALMMMAAPGTEAATIYTRSASCAGINFFPVNSDMEYGEVGVMRTANWAVRCNPALPNGAVVTKVRFTLFDNTNSGEAAFCGLGRVNLKAGVAGPDGWANLGDVPGTGFAERPGMVRLADRSISNATVNNQDYAYQLQCILTTNSQDLGLIGADVIYRISSTKG